MIYLDNAATFWLKPEVVYQTMGQFLRGKWGNSICGSHSLAVALAMGTEFVLDQALDKIAGAKFSAS